METAVIEGVVQVLRYLLERVPHRTQDDHDAVAAVIDALEAPQPVKEESQA